MQYLNFKDARCKDCYKCLRECPVKAIEIVNHQAKIMEDRCILCGKCMLVCPQNAKNVNSELQEVKQLLKGGNVVASVAPAFASSFNTMSFAVMQKALKKLGFSYAEETAEGAKIISLEYQKMLDSGKFKNLITSSCPAVNRLITLYYKNALPFLAPCDTPMQAHAKMLKSANEECKVVFIGPCIAKKREGYECENISAVLTFEDLNNWFKEEGINLSEITADEGEVAENKARFYPISRGVIKSFDKFNSNYEYVAVDGTEKCKEVLEQIDSIEGVMLELNICEYACVNGPCSLIDKGTAVKANATIRKYANKTAITDKKEKNENLKELNFSKIHKQGKTKDKEPSEEIVKEILAKTGKFTLEDELNCGACGYQTCREKAWAVYNGFADIGMCVPYMRERAESMSYEIIKNSPNGIVIVDYDYNIVEINNKAKELYGIKDSFVKARPLFDYIDASEYMIALADKKDMHNKKMFIKKTNSTIELTVILLEKQNVMFGVMNDITEEEKYNQRINQVKLETLTTTDNVIKKQMRVAQEIASLLGETTAETKVALLKLKKTLLEEQKGE